MIAVQLKPSTSTPLSFLKPKPSTSTPTTHQGTRKRWMPSRQRSTTLLSAKNTPAVYHCPHSESTLSFSPSQSSSESSLDEEEILLYETIVVEPIEKKKKNQRPRPRPVSLLQKTKQWSQSSVSTVPPLLLPPPRLSFLQHPPPGIPSSQRRPPFAFLHGLLESMMYGSRITPGLHIPMDLWYQSGACLPFVRAKITASELLIATLEKMQPGSDLLQAQCQTLYGTLLQINDTLMTNLGCPPLKPRRSLSRHRTRLSLRLLRFDRNTPPDNEQNTLYIKVLVKLLTDAQVLECLESQLKKQAVYQDCLSLFMAVVCGWIMKDYEILLDQWFNQSAAWINQ
ncbi:hypothetical protein BY458DRAFT_518856 [Sporodiniella umbellata]|nr:hypothetical protein BY458DRAFT_518856 [Sporodiniella umbellata]